METDMERGFGSMETAVETVMTAAMDAPMGTSMETTVEAAAQTPEQADAQAEPQAMTAKEQMADLERRICALEARTRGVLWSGLDEQASREETLALRYGEYVDKTAAAEILGVTRATVYTMLSDGRIEGACNGRRVNVRSIARYLASPGVLESIGRRGRKKAKPAS